MTHEFEMRDATIIQRHNEHDVLSVRQEIVWPDGSTVGIHPVRQHGANSQLLRAVHVAGHWVLFRLDALMPHLASELPTAASRDKPGIVLYSLRAAYHCAERFLQDAEDTRVAKWPGSPRAATPRPPRNPATALA